MSMGQRMTMAVLVLKSENRLPPDIRTVELEQRVGEKLVELGYGRKGVPSRRTFLRHVDHLRALIQDPDGTVWHSKLTDVSDMVGADDSHEGDDEMRYSNHRKMINITGAIRVWHEIT